MNNKLKKTLPVLYVRRIITQATYLPTYLPGISGMLEYAKPPPPPIHSLLRSVFKKKEKKII
jgi:hypothetical protein